MTFFRYKFNFFYLTKNGLIVGDKILTYHMKDTCNYYNTKSFYLWSMLEPVYRLAALFARGAKADTSARGTKSVNVIYRESMP
jgi:hypothetical protein